MTFSRRNFTVIASLELALMAPTTATVANSLPQEVIDAQQEVQISTTYALNPYLRFCQLKVAVLRGAATVSGRVETDINRDLALEIARAVAGIHIVVNRIVIQNQQDRQTAFYAGEAIDDTTITVSIRSKLYWSRATDGLPIAVETNLGSVTLRGTVDSPASRDLAGHLAISTRGVVAVDNQLVPNGKKPPVGAYKQDMQGNIGNRLSDSWITARVRSTFLYSRNIAGENIAVITQDGIVTLSGQVRTAAERDLAIELAQYVRGVKRVHSEKLLF